MALINCPECGKEVSDSAKHCPYCGFSVQDYINKQIQIEKAKEDSYEKAIELFQSSSSSVKEAEKIFTELGDYLDAPTYLEQCETQFKKLLIEEQEKKKKFSFRRNIVVCVFVLFILSLIAISYWREQQSVSHKVLATFDDTSEFISYSLGKGISVNIPSTWTKTHGFLGETVVEYDKYNVEHSDVQCDFIGTIAMPFYNVYFKIDETQVDYSSRSFEFSDIHIKNATKEYFLQINDVNDGFIYTRIVFYANGDTYILDVDATTEAYSDDLIIAIVNNIIIQ